MLTLTENAAVVVKDLAEGTEGLPDGAGLRIWPQPTEDGRSVGLVLGVVPEPVESDEVVEEAGARVFVDEAALPFLSDKVLDATSVEGAVQFTLNEQ